MLMLLNIALFASIKWGGGQAATPRHFNQYESFTARLIMPPGVEGMIEAHC